MRAAGDDAEQRRRPVADLASPEELCRGGSDHGVTRTIAAPGPIENSTSATTASATPTPIATAGHDPAARPAGGRRPAPPPGRSSARAARVRSSTLPRLPRLPRLRRLSAAAGARRRRRRCCRVPVADRRDCGRGSAGRLGRVVEHEHARARRRSPSRARRSSSPDVAELVRCRCSSSQCVGRAARSVGVAATRMTTASGSSSGAAGSSAKRTRGSRLSPARVQVRHRGRRRGPATRMPSRVVVRRRSCPASSAG